MFKSKGFTRSLRPSYEPSAYLAPTQEEPDYWRHFQKREALDSVEDSGPETKKLDMMYKLLTEIYRKQQLVASRQYIE